MKKALRETQTLRAGSKYSKAEPKKIWPTADFLPADAGRLKFNQLEMVVTFTLKTQFGKDRCTQFRVIVLTNPQTHAPPARPLQTRKHTDRTDNNTRIHRVLDSRLDILERQALFRLASHRSPISFTRLMGWAIYRWSVAYLGGGPCASPPPFGRTAVIFVTILGLFLAPFRDQIAASSDQMHFFGRKML